MPADTNVSLVITGTTKGLATVNRQLGALQKKLMGLTRIAGIGGGKGAVKGAALGSWMQSMGFTKKQVGQVNRYYKDLGIAMRANRMEVTKSAPFLKRHASAMGVLGLNAKKTAGNIRGMGRQSYYAGMMMSRLGYALIAVAAAMTVMGVKSVKAFAEFEANLVDIRALAGLTEEQMISLGEGMRQMSQKALFSASEITKAGVALARTGIIASHSIGTYNKIMEASIILTTAFWRQNLTLTDAVESITRTMRQFNFTADDTDRIINGLAAGSAYTLATIKDLQSGLSFAGAAARSMNVSFEKTLAILGLLANLGIKGTRAGRQFRNILVRLSTANKNATKRQKEMLIPLQKLGLTWDDLNVKSKGFEFVLQNLNTAINDIGDSSNVVRQRAAVAFLVMLEQQGELKKLEELIRSGAKAYEMYSLQMNTLIARFKVFINSLQALGITFGAILGPEVVKILDLLTNMIHKLDELSTAQKKVLLVVVAFTALGLAIMGVTLALAGFFYAAQFGFKFLLAVLAPVFLVMGQLAIIFASVVVAAMLLKRTLEVMKSSVDDTFFQPFRNALKLTITAIKSLVDNVVRFIQTLLRLPDIIKKTIDKIKLGSGKPIGENFVDALNEEFSKTGGVKKFWEQITYGFEEGVRKPLAESGKIVVEELKESFQALGDFLSKQFPEYAGLIDDAVARASSSIKSLTTMLALLEDKHKKNAEAMDKVLTDLAGDTDSIIKSISKTWSDTIFDLVKGTKTFADVWQEVLDNALRNFIHGFVRGMLEGWEQALGKMVADYIRATYIMSAISSFFGLAGATTPGVTSGSISGGGGMSTGVTGGGGMTTGTVGGGGFSTMAEGGIVRRPTLGIMGEAGPEAIVPLDEYNQGRGGGLTIINVVDPNFVNAQIAQDPNTVVNVINADMIKGGSTRKTIKRIR